jgi:type II secretory pathway component PulC
VKRVLAHYESQSEEEAVAEDEAAFETLGQTVMEVPTEIVPAIRELIAKHKAASYGLTTALERSSTAPVRNWRIALCAR